VSLIEHGFDYRTYLADIRATFEAGTQSAQYFIQFLIVQIPVKADATYIISIPAGENVLLAIEVGMSEHFKGNFSCCTNHVFLLLSGGIAARGQSV